MSAWAKAGAPAAPPTALWTEGEGRGLESWATLLTPGSHGGGVGVGPAASRQDRSALCVCEHGLVHLMCRLEMGRADPWPARHGPRASTSACPLRVSRAGGGGREGEMHTKYCERLGWRQGEDRGCSLGTEEQGGLERGRRPHKRGQRPESPAPASVCYTRPRGMRGAGFGGKHFFPSVPGDATCCRGSVGDRGSGPERPPFFLGLRPAGVWPLRGDPPLPSACVTHSRPPPSVQMYPMGLLLPHIFIPFLSICPGLSTPPPPRHNVNNVHSVLQRDEV